MKRSAINKTVKGFTMVELLIVIAIIAGLTSIIIFTYPNAQRRARDAQRLSDIKQYQTAMEIYASRNNNLYVLGVGDPKHLCVTFGLTNCPVDPIDPKQTYRFRSNNTSYVFWTFLEAKDAAGKDQVFVVCSDGHSGNVVTTLFTAGVCPF